MLTFSTPNGKLTHAVKGTAIRTEDSETVLATTLCGRQWTGTVSDGNAREISCGRCADALADADEPRVLSTPEAIQEVYRRVAETGRQRHGRIIRERAERRRRMKEQLRGAVQAASQG